MPRGDLDGFVEVCAFQNVEAGDLIFGFGVRTVGQQDFAVADADGGGVAGWARGLPIRRMPLLSISFTQPSTSGAPSSWPV